MARRDPKAWALLALLFAPLLGTAALCWRYAVDVPVQDEWSLVEDLESAASGEWTWQQVVRSHNGHRLALPRLLLVPLGLATGWRADLPIVANLAAAAALLALLAREVSPERGADWIAAPLFGLWVASPVQWDNYLQGFQVQVFLAVCAAAAALAILARRAPTGGRVAGAALLAVAASWSAAPGLAVWPAGALVCLLGEAPARRRWGTAAIWCALGALAVLAYLHPVPGDAGRGEPSAWVFRHPLQASRFLVATVGHSLVAWAGSAHPPRDSGIAAGVGLAALALGFWLLVRARRAGLSRHAVFAAGLIAWSLTVAGLIAMGRAADGSAAALAPRYTSFMVPFWIGLALVWREAAGGERRSSTGLALLLAASLVSAQSQLFHFPERHRLVATARRALLTGEDPAVSGRLHPDYIQVERALPTVRRLRLSVFRPGEPQPVATSLPLVDPRQDVTVDDPPPDLRRGGRRRVVVRVRNIGRTGWSALGDGASRGMVRLGSRWIDETGAVVAEGPRRWLREDVPPGDSVETTLEIEAPGAPPGDYQVEVSAVQEGVTWVPGGRRFPVRLTL
jgi:hypothetical protein